MLGSADLFAFHIDQMDGHTLRSDQAIDQAADSGAGMRVRLRRPAAELLQNTLHAIRFLLIQTLAAGQRFTLLAYPFGPLTLAVQHRGHRRRGKIFLSLYRLASGRGWALLRAGSHSTSLTPGCATP